MRIGKKETIIVVIIGLILVGGFVVNLLFGIGIGTFRVEQGESEGTVPISEGSPLFEQSDPPRDRRNNIPAYLLLAVFIGLLVARAKGKEIGLRMWNYFAVVKETRINVDPELDIYNLMREPFANRARYTIEKVFTSKNR